VQGLNITPNENRVELSLCIFYGITQGLPLPSITEDPAHATEWERTERTRKLYLGHAHFIYSWEGERKEGVLFGSAGVVVCLASDPTLFLRLVRNRNKIWGR